MTSINPLAREVVQGLAQPHPVHLAYFGFLLVQAVALFLWWPKNDLSRVLSEESAPATLLALIVVMAITIGYHQMRIGAGELLLPGQNHLVEWLMATPLGTGRIVCGHVWGQLLQLCHGMALSSPLLLMAYSVSPAPLGGLLASLLAVGMVVLEIGLMAAIMVLLSGGRDAVRFFCSRGLYVVLLALPSVSLPSMGMFQTISRCLDAGSGALSLPVAFIAGHGLLIAAALAVLYLLACRVRRRDTPPELPTAPTR